MDIKLKGRKFSLRLLLMFLALCMSLTINLLSLFMKGRFNQVDPYKTERMSLIINEVYNNVSSLMLYEDSLYGDIREDSVEAEVERIKSNIELFKNGDNLGEADSKYYSMNNQEIGEHVIENFKEHINDGLKNIDAYKNLEFYSEPTDGTLHFTNTDAESKEEFEQDTLDNYKDYIIFKPNEKTKVSQSLEEAADRVQNLDRSHYFCIRIAKELKQGDPISEIVNKYKNNQKQGYISMLLLIISIIGVVFSCKKLKNINTSNISDISEMKIVKLSCKLGIEVVLLILVTICLLEIDLMSHVPYRSGKYLIRCIVALFIGLYVLILEKERIKNEYNYKLKSVLENESVLLKIYRTLRQNRLGTILLFTIVTIVIAINSFVVFMMLFRCRGAAVFATFTVPLLFDSYIVSIFNSINMIKDESMDIANGIYNKEINISGSNVLREIGENLKNIQNGLKDAVDKAVVSERMKAELITNVSHDLKTPLTSIISYVDLLSQDNVTEDQQKKYLGVLKEKSNRLKVLIEDLFEVSKASSGNIELDMKSLDPVALLRQTLGEFEGKIEESNLKIIRQFPDEKLTVFADGRKTFRVFENLISNILKYSMEGSRVYINVLDEGEYVKVIFKNISREELNFTVEEILQRFKRGDSSRSTEGSGLGLAIAKSLTEVQKGIFDIELDGDLFKSVVKLRKEE